MEIGRTDKLHEQSLCGHLRSYRSAVPPVPDAACPSEKWGRKAKVEPVLLSSPSAAWKALCSQAARQRLQVALSNLIWHGSPLSYMTLWNIYLCRNKFILVGGLVCCIALGNLKVTKMPLKKQNGRVWQNSAPQFWPLCLCFVIPVDCVGQKRNSEKQRIILQIQVLIRLLYVEW